MHQAVLWDFGGVITTSPFDAFNRFEGESDLPQNFIRSVNATNPDTNAWAQFERSEISAKQFDVLFQKEATSLGHVVAGRDVLALLAGDIRPQMVTVLHTLKARGIKLGCITNNVKVGTGAGMASTTKKANEVAKIMRIFDCVIESAKTGIRKPDPRIYTMACEALSIVPANAIFLDDLGINLKPARAMGMRTIKVVDANQAIAELGTYLGFAL